MSNNVIGDSGQGFINNIITDAKDLVSKTIDKISESIKSPIENKINEYSLPNKMKLILKDRGSAWSFIIYGILQNKHWGSSIILCRKMDIVRRIIKFKLTIPPLNYCAIFGETTKLISHLLGFLEYTLK